MNGSPRPKGNTKQMVTAFAEGATCVGNEVTDRFYSAAYPSKPPRLKKIAMILSSGDADMYDGAMFSFKGDFLDYLGLENSGVYTAHGSENGS